MRDTTIGSRPNFLLIEELSDPARPDLPLERMQEEELKRLIGWELNLWLMWRGYATEKS